MAVGYIDCLFFHHANFCVCGPSCCVVKLLARPGFSRCTTTTYFLPEKHRRGLAKCDVRLWWYYVFPYYFLSQLCREAVKVKALPPLPPLLYRKNLVHHPLSCVATARDRVAVVMEQGVERHNMTKSQGS